MKQNMKMCLIMVIGFVLLLALFGSMLNAEPNTNPTWYVDARVIMHRQCSPYDYYAAKDPCIVYSGGKYHVFYTGANQSGGWQMCYTSATTIDGLRNAPRTYMSKIGESYFCAPEVFYFEPKGLWYLIYQDGTHGAAYATSTNIADPNSWSGPNSFGFKDGGLDYFVICDDNYAYMYDSLDNGNIYVRKTTLANFPTGWGSASVAATDTWEGECVYKCLADGKYYMLVEDLKDGRYYELWQSSSAGGPWTKLAEKWAWRGNLRYNADQWTTMVSHGELIRKGINQKYEIDDINKVDFLIQGTTNQSGDYQKITWDLGVIHNYSGPTPTPAGTPTPTPIPGTISIAAGSSSAVGGFQADQYYSGGSTYSNSNTIDVSQITSNPPPAALFNNERYGAMSYTIPGFTASNSYEVTLYFAETYLTSSGSRRFNVSINGATVLSNFDIYATAGGQNKAIARSFTATANSSGQIMIQFTNVTENAKINGISIRPSGTNPTPTPTPSSTVTPTGIVNTPTPTGTVYVSIAAGRTSALGSFQADQYYSGGSTYSNSNTIDVSQITSNPPPAALFNNERYGAMSYTIPGFTAGSVYTVTLYFAETYLTSSGSRLFNVSINGSTVLSNFDIYATAGGQNKAIARSFTATANANGQIVIQFTSGTENPKINGISIK